MDNQQAFDIAAAHLLGLKGRCFNTVSDMCVYEPTPSMREKGHIGCAMRPLIGDLYHPKMEGDTIEKLLDIHPSLAKKLQGVDYRLLDALQEAHDHAPKDAAGFQATVRTELRLIAEAWQLDATALGGHGIPAGEGAGSPEELRG